MPHFFLYNFTNIPFIGLEIQKTNILPNKFLIPKIVETKTFCTIFETPKTDGGKSLILIKVISNTNILFQLET